MTHKEMSEIFAVMLLAYPNAEVFKGGIQKLGPTINLWVTCLPEIDFWTGQHAVVKLCRECKFPPTIAEFREKAESVKSEIRERISQSWMWLKYDMEKMSPEEAYQKLPPDSMARLAIDVMGGPGRLVIEKEHTYGDGSKRTASMYNYRGFEDSYNAVLRRNSAIEAPRRPAIGAGQKQIGEKAT